MWAFPNIRVTTCNDKTSRIEKLRVCFSRIISFFCIVLRVFIICIIPYLPAKEMLKCDRTQQSQNKTLKNSHNPHFYLFFLFSSPVLGKKGPLLCHSAWKYGLPSGHGKSPLCIDGIFPLWTEYFVNCERSAPNLVIIMLKPKPFRFYLKTFPSYTGLW